MHHKTLILLAAVSLSLPLSAQGEEAEHQLRELHTLKTEYQSALDVHKKLVERAKTKKEREEAAKQKPMMDHWARRFWEIVDRGGESKAAFRALEWILSKSPAREDQDRALAMMDLHVDKPEVVSVVKMFETKISFQGEEFVRRVAEEAKLKSVKGKALWALAAQLRGQARLARTLKATKDKKQLKALEKQHGAEITQSLLVFKVPELEAKAEKVLERLLKFDDVPHYTGTLADAAKAQLFELRNLGIGKVAPEIVGKDIDDKPMKLSAYRGKVVVLEFWGQWCGTCRGMHPQMRSLVKRLKGKPFALLGINSDRGVERVREVCKDKDITWRSWFDGSTGGPIARKWNVVSWPTIYVLDHKGVIRFKDVRGDALEDAVGGLIAAIQRK